MLRRLIIFSVLTACAYFLASAVTARVAPRRIRVAYAREAGQVSVQRRAPTVLVDRLFPRPSVATAAPIRDLGRACPDGLRLIGAITPESSHEPAVALVSDGSEVSLVEDGVETKYGRAHVGVYRVTFDGENRAACSAGFVWEASAVREIL